MSVVSQAARGFRARTQHWFAEREIFLRSQGEVRFVRVSRRLQISAAAVAGLIVVALVAWGAATLVMLLRHDGLDAERTRLARAQAAVGRRSPAVASYQHGAAGLAHELEHRQQLIEELVKARLGEDAPVPAPTDRKIGAALPGARLLGTLEMRQAAFAQGLAAAFDARSERAAEALRKLGLNPDRMMAQAASACGGPLQRWPADGEPLTPALRRLASAVERWNLLEDNLVTIPSGKLTDGMMVSSSYGVRSDPFTGAAAFHAGLDFTGAYGQPIVAAAAGRVVFVGDRSGYGHVVEIDHGNGILTRYAHLSRFAATVGETVARGRQIACMGSTGRSTGTHLHFEVRVNGTPVNPRRFLEASQDLMDVQQTAAIGHVDARHRG